MPELTRMGADAAARLVKTVERSIDYASTLGANAGIAKAAAEENYERNHVERVVHLFNTSRAMSFMSSATPEKRADSFELADADAIMKLMGAKFTPTEQSKSACVRETRLQSFSGISASLPEWMTEKRASTEDTRPRRISGLHDVCAQQVASLRKSAELERRKVNDLEYERKQAFDRFVGCLRDTQHEPFQRVESALLYKAGSAAKVLADAAWGQLGTLAKNEKRAEVADQSYRDWSSPVYSSAMDVVRLSRDLITQRKQAEDAGKEYANRKKQLSGLREKCSVSLDIPPTTEDTPAPPSDSTKNRHEYFDPVHEAKIRGIHAASLLNDFVTNDSVLKKYPVESVATVFNEVSNLAPSVVAHPTILSGLMRKLLENKIRVSEPASIALPEALQAVSLNQALSRAVK